MRLAGTALYLVFTATSAVAHAAAEEQIDTLMAASTPPDGVVFEVVEANDGALEWAIPEIERYVKRLLRRFPELSIAFVTHGNEMFALRSESRRHYELLHGRVQHLSQRADVDVHVLCGLCGHEGYVTRRIPGLGGCQPFRTSKGK